MSVLDNNFYSAFDSPQEMPTRAAWLDSASIDIFYNRSAFNTSAETAGPDWLGSVDLFDSGARAALVAEEPAGETPPEPEAPVEPETPGGTPATPVSPFLASGPPVPGEQGGIVQENRPVGDHPSMEQLIHDFEQKYKEMMEGGKPKLPPIPSTPPSGFSEILEDMNKRRWWW